MSDLDNKQKRRSLKNLPPDRFQPKMLVIWLVIVLAAVSLLFFAPGKFTSPANLKIQDVVDLTDQGKVKEGIIRPDASAGPNWVVITGETVTSSLESDRGTTSQFRAAGRLTDANSERLQKSKKFTEQPATTLLNSILAQFIPFLLIIGLLYFLFIRQLRQEPRQAAHARSRQGHVRRCRGL